MPKNEDNVELYSGLIVVLIVALSAGFFFALGEKVMEILGI